MAYQKIIFPAFNPSHQAVLLIDIAELPIRTTQRRQEILQLRHLSIDLEELIILQRRRHPITRHMRLPRNSILPRRQILILPDPPDPINTSMVQPERRVSSAREEITSRVTTDSEVAPGVHPEDALSKYTLHVILEVGDVIACGQQRDCGVGARGYGGILGDVAAQAAWVVAVSVGCGVWCYAV